MKFISDIDLGNLCYELLRVNGIQEIIDIPVSGYARYDKTLEVFESAFNIELDDFRTIASLLIQLTPVLRDQNQQAYHAFCEFGKLTPVATIPFDDGESA